MRKSLFSLVVVIMAFNERVHCSVSSSGAETIFIVDKMATSGTMTRIAKNQAPHGPGCVPIVDTKNVQKCDRFPKLCDSQ